jgi:hypothetical protein
LIGDRNVLRRIVTGDENWYDPETKHQIATSLSPKKPKSQKMRKQKSRVKTLLTAYFDATAIIYHEFIPAKHILNGKCYKDLIKRLTARVLRVRSEFQENGSWYLLHDNAPAPSLDVVSKFLVKMLSYPPYSFDLAPADFLLFSKLKIEMKWTRFEAVSSIQQTVTRELKVMREEAVSRTLDLLYERCKRCAEADGDYIE